AASARATCLRSVWVQGLPARGSASPAPPAPTGGSGLHVGPVGPGGRGTVVVPDGELHFVLPPLGVRMRRILLARRGPVAEAPLPAHDHAVLVAALVLERAGGVVAVHLELGA